MSLPDNGEGSSYYITGDDVNSINILIDKQVNSTILDDVKSKKRKKKHMVFWKVYFYEVQVVNMNFGKYLILF